MPLSSHATRWLVTLVAAPILLYVILVGPAPLFFGLVALAGTGTWYEYFVAVLGKKKRLLMAAALAGWLLTATGAAFLGNPGQLLGLALALALGAAYFLFTYGQDPPFLDKMARFGLGHIYISLCLSFLIPLFVLDHGRYWVLFSLLVTFLSDTGAYYTGRTWGKRPLYTKVSPKKTVVGLLGGMAGGALTALVFTLFLLPVPWYETALLGFFLGLWGTGGDLFESMMKREIGIKDSGGILLGHGGLWDRLDALMFNLPLIYFYAQFRAV